MLQILSRVEESAGTLRQMHSQMMAEDLALSFYPQWEQAVENCGAARQKADRICETMNRFLTVMEVAPEDYMQQERQHLQSIERIQARMQVLGAGLSGVMSPEYPVGMEEGEQTSRAMELERQVAMSAQAMELAGLAATTQVLVKEYAYDGVMPGIPVQAPDQVRDGEGKRRDKGQDKKAGKEGSQA